MPQSDDYFLLDAAAVFILMGVYAVSILLAAAALYWFC